MQQKTALSHCIHKGRWAAAFFLALSATSASAQVCDTPDLAMCQQEGYPQSPCGQQYSELCIDLLSQEFNHEWEMLTDERQMVLPPSLDGGVGTVRMMPYSELGSTYAEGGENTYAGTVLRIQNLYRKNFQSLNPADQAQRDALNQWNANGEAIGSCQEFVHEKYLGYNAFEDRIGAFNTDYRAVFNAAYAQDGIAYKNLVGKSGNPVGPVFDGKRIPKNLYFLAAQGPYPEGTQPYQIDPTLLQLVPPQGRQQYSLTWGWHQQMSNSVAGRADDELNTLFAKQQDFAALVERRDATWRFYDRQRQKVSGPELDALRAQVAAQLTRMDQAIESRLREGQQLGCLGMQGDVRCDWSPLRFKASLDKEMGARREQDYQGCLEIIGNDFGPESFVRHAERLGIEGLSGDYTRNAIMLSDYIAAYRLALMREDTLRDPWTRAMRHSGSRSGGGSAGNAYVGASYAYEAGWELNASGTFAQCTDFDARLYTNFSTDVRLFSTTKEVLYASAEGTAASSGLSYDILLRVLGVDVYHPHGTSPSSFSITKSYSKEKDFFTVEGRIMVWVIPVHVTLGVTGSVGIDAGLQGGLQTGCEFTLSGDVTPWAKLSAFGEAAADWEVFAVGLGGKLTLIRAELPFTAALSIYLDESLNQLRFSVESTLGLTVTMLDGNLYVFVELFGHRLSLTLISYSGLSWSSTLYDEDRDIPLFTLFP